MNRIALLLTLCSFAFAAPHLTGASFYVAIEFRVSDRTVHEANVTRGFQGSYVSVYTPGEWYSTMLYIPSGIGPETVEIKNIREVSEIRAVICNGHPDLHTLVNGLRRRTWTAREDYPGQFNNQTLSFEVEHIRTVNESAPAGTALGLEVNRVRISTGSYINGDPAPPLELVLNGARPPFFVPVDPPEEVSVYSDVGYVYARMSHSAFENEGFRRIEKDDCTILVLREAIVRVRSYRGSTLPGIATEDDGLIAEFYGSGVLQGDDIAAGAEPFVTYQFFIGGLYVGHQVPHPLDHSTRWTSRMADYLGHYVVRTEGQSIMLARGVRLNREERRYLRATQQKPWEYYVLGRWEQTYIKDWFAGEGEVSRTIYLAGSTEGHGPVRDTVFGTSENWFWEAFADTPDVDDAVSVGPPYGHVGSSNRWYTSEGDVDYFWRGPPNDAYYTLIAGENRLGGWTVNHYYWPGRRQDYSATSISLMDVGRVSESFQAVDDVAFPYEYEYDTYDPLRTSVRGRTLETPLGLIHSGQITTGELRGQTYLYLGRSGNNLESQELLYLAGEPKRVLNWHKHAADKIITSYVDYDYDYELFDGDGNRVIRTTLSRSYMDSDSRSRVESTDGPVSDIYTYAIDTNDHALRGRPYAEYTEDGLATVYVYDRGATGDFSVSGGVSFIEGTGGAVRVAMITGLAPDNLENTSVAQGFSGRTRTVSDVESNMITSFAGSKRFAEVRLIPNVSTMSVSIIDERGREVQLEEYVYTGTAGDLWDFERLSWTAMRYTDSGKVEERSYSDGRHYRAYFTVDGTESGARCSEMTRAVVEDGTEITYQYDHLGRLTRRELKAPSPLGFGRYSAAGNLIIEEWEYDIDNRITAHETIDGAEVRREEWGYNQHGRIERHVKDGLVTTLAYNNAERTVTVTLPDGSTVTETRCRDGRVASVTGDTVVDVSYEYDVAENGVTTVTATYGSGENTRIVEQDYDWDGNLLSVEMLVGENPDEYLATRIEYDAYGRQVSTIVDGLSPQIVEYDAMGRANRTGQVAGHDSTSPLDDDSMDEVSETLWRYYKDGDRDWWYIESALAYLDPAGGGTETFLSETWTRVNGTSLGLAAETRVLSHYGDLGFRQEHRTISRVVPDQGVIAQYSTNSLTSAWTATYSLGGRIVRTIEGIDLPIVGSVTENAVAGPKGVISEWYYDSHGRVARSATSVPSISVSTDPDFSATTYDYESYTIVDGVYDPEGNDFESDKMSVVSQYRVSGESSGSALSYVSSDPSVDFTARHRRTRFSYDSNGRVTRTEELSPAGELDPEGGDPTAVYSDMNYRYSNTGQMIRSWGSAGYPRYWEYDDTFHYVTREWVFQDIDESTFETFTPNPGDTSRQYYYVEYVRYPETGLIHKIVDHYCEENDQGVFEVKPPVERTVYTYNSRGQLETRTWNRGVTTTYSYFDDPVGENNSAVWSGRLRSVSYSDSTPGLSYTYGRGGEIRTVEDALGSRSFEYARGVLQYESLPAGEYGPDSYLVYLYDDLYGHLEQVSFSSVSDAPGLLKSRSEIDYGRNRISQLGSGAVNFDVGYEDYATTPNTVSHPFAEWTLTRNRDLARGTLTSYDATAGAASIASFAFSYDNRHRRDDVTQSGVAFSGYDFDRLGRDLTLDFGYNDRSELTHYSLNATDPNEVLSPDQLPGRTFGFRYDDSGNRTEQAYDDTNGNLLWYGYETDGRNRYESRGLPAFEDTSGTAHSEADVDVDGQPASRTGGYFNYRTEFDIASTPIDEPMEFTVAIDASLDLAHSEGFAAAEGESTEIVGPMSAPGTDSAEVFEFDDDGNLKRDALWRYEYDGENRLVSMEQHLELLLSGRLTKRIKVEYTYDYLGRRVGEVVTTYDGSGQSQEGRRFYYIGWTLVGESSMEGALVHQPHRQFIWGPDLSGSLGGAGGAGGLLAIVNLENPADVLLTFSDGRGNVSGAIDRVTGDLEAVFEYGPFGDLLRESGERAADVPFRFSSQWFDSKTQLSYFGFRFYSPSLGRFLNHDPINERGGWIPYQAISTGYSNTILSVGDWQSKEWLNGWITSQDQLLSNTSLSHSAESISLEQYNNSALEESRNANRKTYTLGGPIELGSSAPSAPSISRPRLPASYLYCFNDPINHVDVLGLESFWEYYKSGQYSIDVFMRVSYMAYGTLRSPVTAYEALEAGGREVIDSADATLHAAGVAIRDPGDFFSQLDDATAEGMQETWTALQHAPAAVWQGIEDPQTFGEDFGLTLLTLGSGTALNATGKALRIDLPDRITPSSDLAPDGMGNRPFAMGIDDSLDDFAEIHGATTWKDFDDVVDWKPQVLDNLNDAGTRVIFNLDNVDIWGGVTRASTGRGGATDWELYMIYQNPTYPNLEFWQGGVRVANPFQ